MTSEKRHRMRIAMVFVVLMLMDICLPTVALALTSGPAQPEYTSFEPAGTTEMVDLFSGDFVYNIPLFELPGPDGGYPFNLAYHSGVTMDQEASWVGLGWTLNAGSMMRQVRGVPDDFKGDSISITRDMRPDRTWNFSFKPQKEILGFKIGEKKNNNGKLSLALSVSNNSYRGWSMGMNMGVDVNNLGKKGRYTGGLGLNIDGLEGASIQPSFGLVDEVNDIETLWKLSGSIGSLQGLMDAGLSMSAEHEMVTKAKNGDEKKIQADGSNYHSLSFANRAFAPSSSTSYTGNNFSAFFTTGGKVFFLDAGLGAGVSYSSQRFKNSGQAVDFPAYGYMNLMDREEDTKDALFDYARDRVSPISNSTPNLHIPSYNPDIFSANGQGFGGTFRFYRSDIGVMSPDRAKSVTAGGRLNLEADLGTGVHFGVDAGGNMTEDKNRLWTSHGIQNKYGFVDSESQGLLHESAYLKSPTQTTVQDVNDYNYINDEKTAAFRLSTFGYDLSPIMDGEIASSSPRIRETRELRSQNIQYVKNADLLDPTSGISLSSEFDIDYLNAAGADVKLDRSDRKPDHIAGMTVLQNNGLQYVYGLPQSNLEQHEYLYSVSADADELQTSQAIAARLNTDQEFLEHKSIPRYEQNFLLTSIIGTDYVDCDGIPGASEGDQGYWVKFTYQKTANSAWRAPFTGANLLKGLRAVNDDNKASFVYGVREQFYLAKVESRSHIAEFVTSLRTDAQSPNSLEPSGPTARYQSSHRLDSIRLFSRLDQSHALKTVVFSYDYLLGSQVPNSVTGKKLTLTKLHYLYDSNTRGSLSPYRFHYKESAVNYEHGMYDRWGNVSEKPISEIVDAPYTEQGRISDVSGQAMQDKRDEYSSLWHLDKVSLPSGADIDVTYESDDYAYVQDRRAMQMMHITNSSMETERVSEGDADLRVFFDPEYALSSRGEVKPYLEDLHGIEFNDLGNIISKNAQIYFSVRSTISNSSQEIQTKGYAKVDDYGYDQPSGRPYIRLKPMSLGVSGNKKLYHPIVASTWLKVKSQVSQALNSDDLDYDESGMIDALGRFLSTLPKLRNVFDSYFRYCSRKEIGSDVIANHSFIRLCTPDLKKYGGGTRVKKVELNDKWNNVKYGQVYDYTKVENGRVISSGVAANEPFVGGDESALRFAKLFTESSFLKSSSSNFFEYPINEAYFPGPSVGYSSVTVRSLATEEKRGMAPTGETVNEFYTARDFPTLVQETTLGPDKKRYSSEIKGQLASLFFNVRKDEYVGSQGYSITLNDMHGKPHKITHYGMDKLGDRLDTKVNEVIYHYHEGDQVANYTGVGTRLARTLENELPTMMEIPRTGLTAGDVVVPKNIGKSIEMMVDLSDHKSFSGRAGFDFNSDITPIFIFPLLTFAGFPQVASNTTITRTAVTNKIIRRTGMLKSVEAFDGQSKIVTTNEVYDKITGMPVLTSVNDQFDNKIYQWSIPAHYAYDGMSAASRNWGISTTVNLSAFGSGLWKMDVPSVSNEQDFFVPGDELLLHVELNDMTKHSDKVTLQRYDGNLPLVNELSGVDVSQIASARIYLHRSGHRNLLNAVASSLITSNVNPLAEWTNVPLSVSIPSPNTSNSRSLPLVTIDSVLSGSATTYRDDYSCDDCQRNCYELKCTGLFSDGGGNELSSSIVECTVDDLFSKNRSLQASGCYSGPYSFPLDIARLLADLECYFIDDPRVSLSASVDSTILYIECTKEDMQRDAVPGTFLNLIDCPSSCQNDLFTDGNRGIWRPYEQFNYVDDRESSDLGADLTLKSEDLLHNFHLFDPTDPLYAEMAGEFGWLASNSIQNYADNGEECESHNVLGQFSAVLYDYADNLPVAIASNSRRREFGYEGFETLDPTCWQEQGQLMFSRRNVRYSESYPILGAWTQGSNIVWLDRPFTEPQVSNKSMDMNLRSATGKEYFVKSPTAVFAAENSSALPLAYYRPEFIEATILADHLGVSIPAGDYYGSARVIYNAHQASGNSYYGSLDFDHSGQDDLVLSDFAHTGNKSLRVYENSLSIPQYELQLESGKKYHVSLWVALDNQRVSAEASFENDVDIQIGKSGAMTALDPTSNIINGWQQYEADFVYTSSSFTPVRLEINRSTAELYIDDVRLLPFEASVVSYVYTPSNYRLAAELDENNFATLYCYDDEGNLTVIKKETEQGIKTIQESKTYVKEQE